MSRPTAVRLMAWPLLVSTAGALLAMLVSGAALAQEQVDISALVQETQKSTSDPDKITLVWWIPTEYWEASLAQVPEVEANTKNQILSAVSQYTFMVVVDGTIATFGNINYKPEQDIREAMQVVDAAGTAYRPVPSGEVSQDVQSLLAVLKPFLSNALGPLGENFVFVLFPGKNAQGALLLDPKAETSFVVKLGAEDYRWRLPLGSLLPPKVCPKCQEKLSGAYKFCPYDGTKL